MQIRQIKLWLKEIKYCNFKCCWYKSQKDQIRSLATDAATLAGATINYDTTSKRVTVKGSNGKVYGSAQIATTRLAATGSDYTVYVAMSGLALVIASSVVYRKLKGNA